MKIAIDASRTNKKEKTGVEWYSYFVIEELKNISRDCRAPDVAHNNKDEIATVAGSLSRNDKDEIATVAGSLSRNDKYILYSGDDLRGGLEKLPDNWQEKRLNWPPKYLWTQIRLWWELVVNPPDVLLVTAHTIPFLWIPKKIKVAITVHDVGFKRFPKLYKKIQYWYHNLTMYKIRSRADIIFTVSEFAKSEIVDLYNVNPDKIKVAYNGYDSKRYKPVDEKLEVLTKYDIKKPYLLFVGRIERKKNILNILEAFLIVLENNSEISLVLAGGAGNSIEKTKEFIKDNNLTNRVVLPGYIDEEDLPYLFKSAEIFLFPTLYEGFGIPILQAMAVGTPVIASDQNPHREVGGGSAVYVDPKSVNDIFRGIKKVLSDDKLRKSLIEGGLEQVKKFTWKSAANNIFKYLQD